SSSLRSLSTASATPVIYSLSLHDALPIFCEGDPLLYGSFAHLVERLRARFECEAIPGISAMSAAAAACLQPLAVREQPVAILPRSEEHTSELQSRENLVCRLLLEKKNSSS